jgi:mannose-6-phosphate isomerase-like protein (cupin superfamily)
MQINRRRSAIIKYEYGCDLRRLFPWEGVTNPLWGAAIASVRIGESTTPHAHDEDETFLILAGSGEIIINDEREIVEKGDVVFLPRNTTHQIENKSSEGPLEFLSIFWGSPEANERLLDMADEMKARMS